MRLRAIAKPDFLARFARYVLRFTSSYASRADSAKQNHRLNDAYDDVIENTM